MKDCKQFQQQYLLDGGCQNDEIAEHFIKCPQCQAFAQDYAQILPTTHPQPSDQMEKKLRMVCQMECANIRRNHLRRRMFKSFISAAAVVLLIAGAVFHYSAMPSQSKNDSKQVAVSKSKDAQHRSQNGMSAFDDSTEFVWSTACTLSENELDILETDLALYVFNP